MKTRTNGWFYIPNLSTDRLKVEKLFNNTKIVGDQIGGTSPYDSIAIYPNGVVDITDIAFVSGKFGSFEGQAGWEYMADVSPNRVVDITDIAMTSGNFGNVGTYSTNLSGVTVTFNTGEELSIDEEGFVTIPQNALSFTVKRNGNPIGAIVTFW